MPLGLGTNLSSTGMITPGIVTSNLVLKHNYAGGGVVPVSDGAAFFDGTDDYIALGATFSHNVHSISTWIKVTADATNKFIFDARDGDDDGIVLYIDGDEDIKYEVVSVMGHYNTPITAGWNHIAATNDGTTSRIYLNGIEVETADTSGVTVSTTTNAKIGTRSHSTVSNFFNGYMCNVGFWSGVLTQAQIKSIMWKNYAGLTDSEKTNLVSWWNLDTETNTSGEAGTGGVKDSEGTNHGELKP